MNKDEYVKRKIKNYYKEKSKSQHIEENYKKKSKSQHIKENYKEKSKSQNIEENYKEKSKESIVIYKYRKLREIRPIYKIINNLSLRINKKLVKLKIKKEFTYTQILGCTVNEFEIILSNKMIDGMTYSNYGEWKVDHILPFSSFDFHNIEEIKICCHHNNLQPLWLSDNRKKSEKIITPTKQT